MKNPNDVFYLARYAHNQLAPLFEQAKAVEPSIHFAINLHFASEGVKFYDCGYIEVQSHWDRTGMFQYTGRLKDKAEVDQFLTKLREDTEALRPLVLVEV